MTKGKKQPEVIVIDKVCDFITTLFPDELQKANKEYQETNEAQSAKEESTYRGFLSYFLLQRCINGVTPMEYAYSFPLAFFSKKEKEIIRRFMEYVESLFTVMKISDDGKDFWLQDVSDNKEYVVKTIDFPLSLKKGDIIRALLVKRKDNGCFFYGNVWTYSKKDGKYMKNLLITHKKMPKRKIPDIEWDILRREKRKHRWL